ncbi:hypothetical protein BH11BAC3_BH11BAC3_35300 [soil metagenome]
MQYEKLKVNKQIDFGRILRIDEQEVLVAYGNHVSGAMFLNYNRIVDEELINTFDSISKHIPGFYFARYNIGCTIIEDFKKGKNIAVLELNGAGAEPSHIRTSGFSFF